MTETNNFEINNNNFIKGIFICKISGECLVELCFDENLKTDLLSAFIGALSMFGKENVGKIDEIVIKGWDLEMFLVTKHDLILTALFSPDMQKKNIKHEAEIALDSFYENYKSILDDWDNSTDDFNEFKELLMKQIEEYFEKIKNGKAESESDFWDNLLKNIRNE